jgi:hypothetical protein
MRVDGMRVEMEEWEQSKPKTSRQKIMQDADRTRLQDRTVSQFQKFFVGSSRLRYSLGYNTEHWTVVDHG